MGAIQGLDYYSSLFFLQPKLGSCTLLPQVFFVVIFKGLGGGGGWVDFERSQFDRTREAQFLFNFLVT